MMRRGLAGLLAAILAVVPARRSRFVITPRASGNPFSHHATDLSQAWRDNAAFAHPPKTH